jgi:hypothetical protein
MGTHRGLRRAGALCALGALVAAVSCLDATEVTLVVTTDVPCKLNQGTAITIGDPSEVLTQKTPQTITRDCTLASPDVDDSGALTSQATIGTLVVVPSAGRSDSFRVQIVMALDPNMSPDDCLKVGATNCIAESREVSFIPHTPITLPIEITLDCENVTCLKGTTCDHGHCVVDTAHVDCTGGGACNGNIPPEAGSVQPEAGPSPDAPFESPMSDASVQDQLVVDQTVGSEIPDVVATESGPTDEPDVGAMDVTVEPPPADVTTADTTVQDAPADVPPEVIPEASSVDAPAETSTTDGSLDATVDASVDAPAEAPVDAQAEVSVDAPADVQDTGTTSSTGYESDASPLVGTCPVPGSSSGVACGGGVCGSGQACCVTVPMFSPPVESCMSLAACQSSPITPYTALFCRNGTDCPSGQVCCFTAAGSGETATCSTTCTTTITTKALCDNSCECTGGNNVCNAKLCFGAYVGICGLAAGSSCP